MHQRGGAVVCRQVHNMFRLITKKTVLEYVDMRATVSAQHSRAALAGGQSHAEKAP